MYILTVAFQENMLWDDLSLSCFTDQMEKKKSTYNLQCKLSVTDTGEDNLNLHPDWIRSHMKDENGEINNISFARGILVSILVADNVIQFRPGCPSCNALQVYKWHVNFHTFNQVNKQLFLPWKIFILFYFSDLCCVKHRFVSVCCRVCYNKRCGY